MSSAAGEILSAIFLRLFSSLNYFSLRNVFWESEFFLKKILGVKEKVFWITVSGDFSFLITLDFSYNIFLKLKRKQNKKQKEFSNEKYCTKICFQFIINSEFIGNIALWRKYSRQVAVWISFVYSK